MSHFEDDDPPIKTKHASQEYRDGWDRVFGEKEPAPPACDHGVTFDEFEAAGLDAYAVRERWPRLYGDCPKGCGFNGIGYASMAHYVCGDW